MIYVFKKIIYIKYIFFVAIANEKLKIYGVQFHPEVDLTTNGKLIMKNFLYNISGLSGSFTMQSREAECIEYIKKHVGKNKVLVSTSIYSILSLHCLNCVLSYFLSFPLSQYSRMPIVMLYKLYVISQI